MRDAIAETNDAAFPGGVDTVGIVGPCDRPGAGPVPSAGLQALIGY